MSLALDRQIRPIYDALDTGSNKSAIVACNKLLKKHPKNDLVKALKALALVRSQKVEESLVLCDEVLAARPADDSVLSAMMHVLRGLGRHNDMVTMFEEAYKQQPGNEELAAQTFFANVRAGHWKSAQQIATKMHKQFQEERYLYWSVISTVLQANDITTPPPMRTLLFKLAHRMITSSSTSPYQNADRLHLQLVITRELGLLDEAHKLLDNAIGSSICATNLACNEIRRDIWRLKGLWIEEAERAEQLITAKNDRNWLEFLSVIDGTFHQASGGDESSSPEGSSSSEISDRVSKSQKFFERIAEKDGRRDRSGLLALLELERRVRLDELATDPARMVTLLQQYFETFGDKACCFEDLKPYLRLTGDDLSKWTSTLSSVAPSFTTLNELQRLINSHKLLRNNLTESDLTVEAEQSRATIYTKQYIHALPLGANLPSTELQPADDLAILAGTTFVNLWALTQDEKYLYQTSALLEFALTKSQQCFSIRLMLIRVYRLLGAPSLALDHYRLMLIRQVQHDTLSHFILSRSSNFSLAASGDLTMATECIEATQIYLSNSQETSDFVVRAFTQEKYSQIPEFISFEDQLDNSFQRDMIKMEHLRMRLAHEPVTSDIIDMELIELKFIFDRTHHDNRDFEILPNYQPYGRDSLEQQTLLFGKREGQGWLWSFLKVYIRAFQLGSDLDDTVEEKLLIGDRPKQSPDPERQIPLRDRLLQRNENELVDLTAEEQSFIAYADALTEWLEPYHDHVRPPPAVVLAEAAKQTELKTGHPLKGVEIPLQNGNFNGKKDEEAPPIKEAPELVSKFFEDMKVRFDQAKDTPSPANALHIATIVQEALLLFVVVTLRFKSASVVKIHKLSALVTSIKGTRAKAIAISRDIAAQLVKNSEQEGTADRRKVFVDACSPITSEIDHDFILDVAKRVTDARKKVTEGVGKGLAGRCSTYAH